MKFSLVIIALLLIGCATSKVTPIGNGHYMIAKTGGGPLATGAQMSADLYRIAQDFCAKYSKEMVRVSVEEKDNKPFVRLASSNLEFKCE